MPRRRLFASRLPSNADDRVAGISQVPAYSNSMMPIEQRVGGQTPDPLSHPRLFGYPRNRSQSVRLQQCQNLCRLLVGDAKQRNAGLHENLLPVQVCGGDCKVRVADGNGRIRQARLRRLQ